MSIHKSYEFKAKLIKIKGKQPQINLMTIQIQQNQLKYKSIKIKQQLNKYKATSINQAQIKQYDLKSIKINSHQRSRIKIK